MHPMNRRGFTIAELLVALVLASVVGLAIIKMLNSSEKLTRTQFGRMDSQQSAMSAAYYLNSVLRELDASEGDIVTATSSTLGFRGMRWTGMSCTTVTTSGSDLLVTLKDSLTFGVRAPDHSLDSLLVFSENTPTTRSDDVWLDGWLVGKGTGTCDDGSPGTTLTFRITTAAGGNAACTASWTVGSPIRGFQREELSLYADGAGANWLGRRSMDQGGTWTAIEQLAGPLASNGLALTYRDTLNAVTATLANIASVGVILRTRSADITGANPGNVRDSLITRVALRNNKRF
jgi:prepilin-type N-terminal cleavage/methylation domain-containing protein